jgi:transcriptional regulator with XRE-family HTH domain
MTARKKKPGPLKGSKHKRIVRSAFGQRLFDTRKARGLTQKELGAMTRLSKRMIAYYEANTSGPPVEILRKLSEVLNVTSSYLLGESPLKAPLQEEMTPSFRRYVEILKNLPPEDKKTALKMIEAIAAKSELTRKGKPNIESEKD